jgi:hypothetical protein
MTLAIVTFHYGDEFDSEHFARMSRSRRDFYVGLEGLRQKLYWVAPERREAGGAYVWELRNVAEGIYSEEWRTRAEQVFGARPEVQFFEITDVIANQPVTV